MHNAGRTIHLLFGKFKLQFLISSNELKSKAVILYNRGILVLFNYLINKVLYRLVI